MLAWSVSSVAKRCAGDSEADQQRVLHVEILQGAPAHDRPGIGADTRRAFGRQQQKRLDLPPRGVVADRQRGRDEDAFRIGEPRIVRRDLAHDDGVRDRHFFPSRRLDLGRERAQLRDRALDVADPDEVTDPHRARVGDGEAAHDLVDDAARPERQHDADEHAHPFEGVGIAARQIGVGEHQAKQPDQRRHQPARRLGRLGIRVGKRQPAILHRLEHHLEEPHHEAGDQQDQQNREQVGNGVDYRCAEQGEPIEQERSQGFAPWAGVRKPPEDEGQPVVADEQPQDDENRRDSLPRDIGRPRDLDEHVSRRQLLELPFGDPGRPYNQVAVKAPRHQDQDPGDDRRQQRPRGAGGDSPRRPELDRFVDRLLEVPDGRRARGLQGLSRERVDVERDDGEDVAAADGENAGALQRARRDRPWLAVVDNAIEAVAGSLGPLRRRPRQDRRAENGDLTVVVDSGGPPAPGVAVDTSWVRSCAATRTWTTAAAINATPSATRRSHTERPGVLVLFSIMFWRSAEKPRHTIGGSPRQDRQPVCLSSVGTVLKGLSVSRERERFVTAYGDPP